MLSGLWYYLGYGPSASATPNSDPVPDPAPALTPVVTDLVAALATVNEIKQTPEESTPVVSSEEILKAKLDAEIKSKQELEAEFKQREAELQAKLDAEIKFKQEQEAKFKQREEDLLAKIKSRGKPRIKNIAKIEEPKKETAKVPYCGPAGNYYGSQQFFAKQPATHTVLAETTFKPAANTLPSHPKYPRY